MDNILIYPPLIGKKNFAVENILKNNSKLKNLGFSNMQEKLKITICDSYWLWKNASLTIFSYIKIHIFFNVAASTDKMQEVQKQ